MKQQAIVTIVSNNYLHYARTLMQSVARQHPQAQRYVVIVDADMGPAAALAGEFDAIALSELGLPHGDGFLYQYTILELNTAVKPWALQTLLDRGHSSVMYIDPDIYVYRPLTEVQDLLAGGASMVLTPHLLAPMTDTRRPTELDIRIAGTYNLGFCALREHPATRAFLSWWQGKLARDCVVDFAVGIFVDQSWVDLAPGMFDEVAVLRHPGYNVAYWNLAQREVSGAEGQWQVNGQPLVFFHYSGIDPQDPHKIAKHQNRHTMDTVSPAVAELVRQYCSTVIANGQQTYRKLPYAYATYRDGRPITQDERSAYRTRSQVRRLLGDKPFERAPEAAAEGPGPRRLVEVYWYFLGRAPDQSALSNYRESNNTWYGYLRLVVGVARSAEARSHRGWALRTMLWPLRRLKRVLLETAQVDGAPVALPPPAPAPAAPANVSAPSALAAPGINLVGYIAAELGVGEAARSLARACHAVDVPYSVVDVGYQSSNLQRDTQALAQASKERFGIDLVYVNADQTATTIEHIRKLELESPFKIGFWHWEQPQIPAAHLAAFANLNEIWVPSRFVHDAVAAVSPLPVVIVPHALKLSATPGVKRSQFGLPADKVLALVMYDFHSYQHRKNPQAAIAAFRQAAQGRSDCALVVKTINGHYHPEAAKELRDHLADLPDTVMIDQFLTRQETWDLQSCCDLLVSLHRAEGFGLAPAEMMYLGKPVVATGWSANMDFMTTENSMPVRYTLEPLKEAIGAYPAGPVWAEADIDHAADCIRSLLDDAALRQRLGQRAARDVQRQLSPETVGKLVRERLQTLAYWHPSLRR